MRFNSQLIIAVLFPRSKGSNNNIKSSLLLLIIILVIQLFKYITSKKRKEVE